jgi:hypothetical protein
MDNPDLIVACVVGDGEAESGPTATFVVYSRSSLNVADINKRTAPGTLINTSILPNQAQFYQSFTRTGSKSVNVPSRDVWMTSKSFLSSRAPFSSPFCALAIDFKMVTAVTVTKSASSKI